MSAKDFLMKSYSYSIRSGASREKGLWDPHLGYLGEGGGGTSVCLLILYQQIEEKKNILKANIEVDFFVL